MSNDDILLDTEDRMEKAVAKLKHDLAGLRTGRANPGLVDSLRVDAYGSMTPLNHVSNISVAGPGLLSVQVWDKALTKHVESAIREANLGLNPHGEGQVIRVPLPPLTQERRNELAKQAHKYAENHRVAVRNVRREGMDLLKKLEKDGKMSEDEHHKNSAKVQELTDKLVKEIDQTLATKETEIHKV